MSAEELYSSNLWWNPPFLQQTTIPSYQESESKSPTNEAHKEERNHLVSHVVNLDSSMIDKYSNVVQLQRHSAWLTRFCQFLDKKRKQVMNVGPLTVIEMQQALHSWIRVIQRIEFAVEISALEKNSPISRTSKLLSLNPRLDPDGFLRVGGRIDKAPLPYNERHPILLPRHNRLTWLLVDHTHRTLKHAGCQLVLFHLQQNYWIIRGKPLVRNCINKCKICVLQKAKTMTQVMGNLPQSRVTPSRPFSFVGIDYAGPVLLRTWHGRKAASHKAYIALFVCFSTKAIHLELVSDMTSETFIAALRRFSARRGSPTHIYSDCGTNFVGANRELQEFLQFVKTHEHNEFVARKLASQGIPWSFNPPGAPHMGGLWEAGVKSAKFHLRRCIGDTPLTFEEYSTLLCEVEACLNSRPLTPASTDCTDLLPICPGHFLIGAPLEALPEADLTLLKISHLSRWQHVQQMTQNFWNRWSQEYLRQLQRRPKWNETHPDLKVGDMVAIQDERLPPRQWRMARVKEVHPGNDGRVRVATLQKADGELVRPVVKLCRLLVEHED
ncbi:unnamed protein product [Allacma fusca]|uniref:Integrase catalytic domain-containing protein n=1 Tax=Allacma fusca TaxID=39272 RepID=A0A8J2JXS4_9HEXA|nr:unnamed protein product [Allacma fusca]